MPSRSPRDSWDRMMRRRGSRRSCRTAAGNSVFGLEIEEEFSASALELSGSTRRWVMRVLRLSGSLRVPMSLPAPEKRW